MLSLRGLALCKLVGKGTYLIEIALYGRIGIMEQITPQVLHSSLHQHGVMGSISTHSGLVTSDKTKLGVGIPVSVHDPATEKADLAVKPASVKPVDITAGEERGDRLSQLL